MTVVPVSLRRLVVRRAGNRCEYCLLSQIGQEATFHTDHILPRADGGASIPENLALACVSCSLFKQASRLGIDPATKKVIPLFDPRRQKWQEHFRWDGFLLVGLTPTGRATVSALKMTDLRS